MPDSRLRSAVSLLALGGRLAVLPVAETAHTRSLAPDRPGIMCIHASASFSVVDGEEERPDGTGIPCFVELAVRRNAAVGLTQQTQAWHLRTRQPGGLLRVRCANTALRCSVLEALSQQLMSPQLLLDAAAVNLMPKNGVCLNVANRKH